MTIASRVSWVVFGILSGCAGTSEAGVAETRSPNVILVMADDLGWGDTGFHGHPWLRTPHLDAMAANGIRFDRFYAASPVCSPTRGSCLTGRHPERYGIASANRGHLRAEEITLAELLGAAGYATGHFGKWHLGTMTADFSGKGPKREPEKNHMTPAMAGFDTWFSTEFAVATWDPYDPANTHRGNAPWDPRALYWEDGVNIESGLEGCDSKITMDRALGFVERAVGEEQPFFAVIWFHAPHAPVIGGEDYRALYAERSEDDQHYGAVVSALDAEVGRLRAALRRLGAADNTMIWFCSDNGPEGNPGPRGRSRGPAGPFRGRKRSLYEGGVRVPAVLEWPARFDGGGVVAAACSTSDYLPTVCAAVGIDPGPARALDGIDLGPVLDGHRVTRGTPLGFHHGSQSSWHDGRFKLVHNRRNVRHRSDNGDVPVAEWELYDLYEDPGETVDLAPVLSARVERMRGNLERWRIGLGLR